MVVRFRQRGFVIIMAKNRVDILIFFGAVVDVQHLLVQVNECRCK